MISPDMNFRNEIWRTKYLKARIDSRFDRILRFAIYLKFGLLSLPARFETLIRNLAKMNELCLRQFGMYLYNPIIGSSAEIFNQ